MNRIFVEETDSNDIAVATCFGSENDFHGVPGGLSFAESHYSTPIKHTNDYLWCVLLQAHFTSSIKMKLMYGGTNCFCQKKNFRTSVL